MCQSGQTAEVVGLRGVVPGEEAGLMLPAGLAIAESCIPACTVQGHMSKSPWNQQCARHHSVLA